MVERFYACPDCGVHVTYVKELNVWYCANCREHMELAVVKENGVKRVESDGMLTA